MDSAIAIGSVVQFTEAHKWVGCLGIVHEIKDCGGDLRYTVGVQVPQQGTAFIFCMRSKGEIELIGPAHFVPADMEADDD